MAAAIEVVAHPRLAATGPPAAAALARHAIFLYEGHVDAGPDKLGGSD